MSKKEFIITIIIVVLAIALVATVIVLKRADNAANGTPTTAVPHDHNGDGIPDHGDDEHGETTAPTTGGNGDAADPNDSDVDISVDLEDIPSGGEQGDSTKPTTGTTEPTTGTTDPTTGATEPESGSNDSTQPTTGGNDSTEPTTGGNSGAVNGNEIDFDDLLNAGKN